MPFWSKERLESEHSKQPLVNPFAPERIEQNGYALGVAKEYAITSAEGGGAKRSAGDDENITIPPGQFALLLTEEKLSVPAHAMAFISMKAKFKLRGLINVSGFHVDPGFSGRLKFAVYNAGSVAIDLQPGQRLFLIWYCDLDRTTTALYSGSHQGQDGITPDDVMSIRGIVISPAGISSRVDSLQETTKSELQRLEHKIDTHQNWARPVLTGIAVGLTFVLISAVAKPWLESLVRGGTAVPQATAPAPPPASQPLPNTGAATPPRP